VAEQMGLENTTRSGRQCIETHQAMIYDRGGERRLWQLVDVASVKWNRNLDGQSTGELVVAGEACVTQADVLGRIEPHRHELVLFRNGERVWEGPIVQVGWFRDRATLLAHDVSEYLKWTALSKWWPNEDAGGPPLMLDRVKAIIEHELTVPYVMSVGTGEAVRNVAVPRWENLDPPVNVLPHLEIRAGSVLTRSVTEAFEMTLFEHIQNLSRGGMDWTVIGRKILFWDRKEVIGRTRTLTDNDFYGDIEVFASGSDNWQIEHVVATPAEEEMALFADEQVVLPMPQEWTAVRSNLHTDPQGTALDEAAWGSHASHTLSNIVDGDGRTWVRSTRNVVGTTRPIEMRAHAMEPHTPYRLLVRVRSSSSQLEATVALRGSVTDPASGVDLGPVTIPQGESVIDISGSWETEADGRPAFTIVTGSGGVGSTLDVREVLIESPVVGRGYFDGDTAPVGQFRYFWLGSPNDSPSIEEASGDGSTEEDPFAVGSAGGPDDFYGVWTHITTSQNEEGTQEQSQDELNSQASRNLIGRNPVPLEIRVPTGGGIKPSFDLTIADLVPGVEVPVLATLNLRRVSQLQRIDKVTVTEDSEREEVGVTLVPYGDVTGPVGGML
jgi:hypothetical protein